jgi:hypothetical protein
MLHGRKAVAIPRAPSPWSERMSEPARVPFESWWQIGRRTVVDPQPELYGPAPGNYWVCSRKNFMRSSATRRHVRDHSCLVMCVAASQSLMHCSK